MTAVSGIPTRPLYDSTDSLLRFAMRADATLTGLCGLAVAFFADQLSPLTGLTSFQEFAPRGDRRRRGQHRVHAGRGRGRRRRPVDRDRSRRDAGEWCLHCGLRRAAIPGSASPHGVASLPAGAGRRREMFVADVPAPAFPGRYSLRRRNRLMEWSASLRSTRVARGRVGRMFSTRLGRLIERQISRAAATAFVSLRAE